MASKISVGVKLLALSVFFATSSTLTPLEGTSQSMETTKEWLRVGRMAEAEMTLSTRSSGNFMLEYVDTMSSYHVSIASLDRSIEASLLW